MRIVLLLLLLAGCPGAGGTATSSGPGADRDGDGFAGKADCDDGAPMINPAAVEVCSRDGIDNDCDGDKEDRDADCERQPRQLLLMGQGATRFAVHHGPSHDLLLELKVEPAPAPAEIHLTTDPVTIDLLAAPLGRTRGRVSAAAGEAGREVDVSLVAVLHARQLIPDGPLRRDLAPAGKWLLFGAGDDFFLAWTRVEKSDPVQVAKVTSRDPLPALPMRVPLPVRPLRINEVIELDLGGGVKRALQVMAEPVPARGWSAK